MKKNIIALLVVLVVIAGIATYFAFKKSKNTAENTAPVEASMCYFYSRKTASGAEDREWLRMKIVGSDVTGEHYYLPGERDSKTGSFTGTVTDFDPAIAGRKADVWWDSMAEGMRNTEELMIEFGEGSAVALFGEMVLGSDGTYVYKDKTKVTPGFLMSQVDCVSLAERLAVEDYVRGHIGELSPEAPVLGGRWYVTAIDVDTVNDDGIVNYEDGHITRANKFSYKYNPADGSVVIENFNFGK